MPIPTTARRVTLKSVAAYILQERGVTVELVRGDGYHYFVGDACDKLQSSSVYSPHLTSLTLAQWLGEWDQLVKESW